ncbi:MAG TPA: hypothetical protein VFA81_03535 [Burkholderiales bacterium]|nr:hypothetical protein [Burkholderiales bacterium]
MAWFTKIEVEVTPAELRIVTRSVLGRGRKFQRVPVRNTDERAISDKGEAWVPCVQALARVLSEMHMRNATLRLIVSDHFVRYGLLPWSENVVRDPERAALARFTFKQLFGNLSDDWEIALDEQSASQSSYAVAMDRPLLEALRELCKVHKLRLSSIVPVFVARYNEYRRRLRGRTYCVASVERGRLTLAFRGERGWFGVRSRRLHGSLPAELADGLRQETATLGVPNAGALFLIGPEELIRRAAAIPGWSVTRLGDDSLAPSAALAESSIGNSAEQRGQ